MSYLNIHVLFSIASANPNRDDLGAPKTIVLGGTERARISSQAMTRAKRLAYEASPSGERSVRSALLPQNIVTRVEELVTAAGGTISEKQMATLVKKSAKLVFELTMDAKKAETKAEKLEVVDVLADDASAADAEVEAEAGDTLVWLAEAEVDRIAAKLAEGIIASQDTEVALSDVLARQSTASLAIAAFGRMFANRPDLQNEAAIQRADALGVTPFAPTIDFFTAVDDLRAHGAGHMGRKWKTSSQFYWHCNINREELLSTWERPENNDEARERLIALFQSLFTALPSGGQNGSAHHTLPHAIVAVPASSPISLHTAFDSALADDASNGDGLTALMDELEAVRAFAPQQHEGDPIVASTLPESGSEMNMEDLSRACASWVLGD